MSSATTVTELVKEINEGLSQRSSSRKDEITVMQAMMNDPTYEVSVYSKEGPVEVYNPCQDFRGMCASVISSAARIPAAEAATMMDGYTAKRAEAASMVNVSKEFINTFIHTGRKLPLGGRQRADISLSLKEVPETVRPCPHKNGTNPDGSIVYSRNPITVNAHESVRVHAPCPAWIK